MIKCTTYILKIQKIFPPAPTTGEKPRFGAQNDELGALRWGHKQQLVIHTLHNQFFSTFITIILGY